MDNEEQDIYKSITDTLENDFALIINSEIIPLVRRIKHFL